MIIISAKISHEIITFWFGKDTVDWPSSELAKRWFTGGKTFDALIRENFSETVNDLLEKGIDHTNQTAETNLSAILTLDQFTRNIFRGTSKAFAGDEKALKIAQYMLDNNQHEKLALYQQIFLYLPFEHAENQVEQQRSKKLFEQLLIVGKERFFDKLDGFEHHAREHAHIIEQFGRFPHRNKVLNRLSTAEEIEYLENSKTFGQ